MTEDESMLRCHGGVRHNNIMHILNNEQTRLGDVDIINQLHYLVEENINMGLNFKKNDFTILSLNCQSISAKFDNLKIFFENVDQFSAVCLQESWLSTVSDTRIKYYKYMSNLICGMVNLLKYRGCHLTKK